MRIAMVIPSFYPLVGGAEKQLEGLAKELISMGSELKVYTRSLPHSKDFEMHSGIPIRRVQSKFFKLNFMFSLSLALFRARKSFDIIHSHSMNGQVAIPSILLGYALRKPVIFKITRSGQGAFICRLKKSMLSRFYISILRNIVGYFVAITDEVRIELMSIGIDENKIISIPNAVEILPMSKKATTDVTTIVCVNRLIKRKNVPAMINALDKIKDECNVKLIIVGDGPERKNLEGLVSRKTLDHIVQFTGSLEHHEVKRILQSADIFVLPSSSEGMSNALLEAMSSGLAVVANDISANRAVIESGVNGILCDIDRELSVVLKTLIEDSLTRERIIISCLQSVKERYDFGVISKQYLKLYERCYDELR